MGKPKIPSSVMYKWPTRRPTSYPVCVQWWRNVRADIGINEKMPYNYGQYPARRPPRCLKNQPNENEAKEDIPGCGSNGAVDEFLKIQKNMNDAQNAPGLQRI